MSHNFPPPPSELLQKLLPLFLSVRRNAIEWISSRRMHLGGVLQWIVIVFQCVGSSLMARSSNLPSEEFPK